MKRKWLSADSDNWPKNHQIPSIPANVSSQYISALLLVAPKLQDGIKITLVGEITSVRISK
jgi:5-enolpyruvylshikimate-3-phosphate synthase